MNGAQRWRQFSLSPSKGERAGARGILFVILCLCFRAPGSTITETFASNPLTHGWRIFGQTNLFVWNSANQNLSVTWDSSQPNSYFYIPLGTILNRQDDFSMALDLQLSDIAGGVNPAKPFTFELAMGFLNSVNATETNFFRGNGSASPNLVEFDFFPDTGYGPTIWPALWSTNSVLNFNGAWDYTILDLPVGVWMHITMTYTASNQTLSTRITTNGVPIGAIGSVTNNPRFTDFRAGAFAIESYSDAAQNPQDSGSLLAHGIVDNLVITIPPPPIQMMAGKFVSNAWQVSFLNRTNWVYTLERSTNLQPWAVASATISGNGTNLTLYDSNAVPAKAFYRVRAERP
jgi:hypothetical protein